MFANDYCEQSLSGDRFCFTSFVLRDIGSHAVFSFFSYFLERFFFVKERVSEMEEIF